MSTKASKSIIKYSAEYGIYCGLYLLLMSACLIASVHYSPTILFTFPLALGIPIIVYALMIRMSKQEPVYHNFRSLWSMGVFMFLFGAMICGVITGGYFILIEPDFMLKYITNAIETMAQSPVAIEYTTEIETLRQAVDKGVYPTPMQFVFTMLWSTAFFGSILSAIMAFVVHYRKQN